MYNVIDLFAGAGGLSYGFMQTKKFEIKLAAENNSNAKRTYVRNHSGTDVVDDVRSIDYLEVKNKYGQIDVVIGGPPCQGFSNANRQKNHIVSQNNRLVKEYIRAVIELQPKVFVMENVSMLKSNVHRFYYTYDDETIIKKLDITMQNDKIEILPKYINISNVNDIIHNNKLLSQYKWQENIYSVINILFKVTNNEEKLKNTIKKYTEQIKDICLKFNVYKDSNDEIYRSNYQLGKALLSCINNSNYDTLKTSLDRAIQIQRMVNKILELNSNNIKVKYLIKNGVYACVQSYAIYEYIKKVLESSPNNYLIKSDVLNAADFGVPQKRMRFIIIGKKRSDNELYEFNMPEKKVNKYNTVSDAIFDLQDVPPAFNVTDAPIEFKSTHMSAEFALQELRDSEILHNHIITKTTETAMERFKEIKQGENFHNLSKELKESTYSDISRTQNTIYLRLKYDEPSGTVVNVRKSMWIHPCVDRAISIREAARLQSFPDTFVFEGTKDSQYQQVGNAVPPLLAKGIAEKVIEILDSSKF